MGKRLILEFTDRETAEQCLQEIDIMLAAYWSSKGYTVTEEGLIGKNLGDNTDAPKKALTTKWDDIYVSPDGTFYFNSIIPSKFNNEIYNPRQFTYTEKEIPDAWEIQEDDTNIVKAKRMPGAILVNKFRAWLTKLGK